ncbi:hypothetical protein [Dactylosporangium darangshiense]|uniref:Uncharacterized protein n=1 Tax=Dactylosporangium darangshiense TaxID=579108 RepID=A0ABP8DMU7_9ACTN
MRVLFIVSAFNGLSQRAWCALRAAGHDVTVEFAIDDNTMIAGAHLTDPDIIICPYLKDRVPDRSTGRQRPAGPLPLRRGQGADHTA